MFIIDLIVDVLFSMICEPILKFIFGVGDNKEG
jgi:hypothetical protein